MWTKSTISDVRPVGVLDADSVLLQLTRPESAHDGNIVVPSTGRAAALCGDVRAGAAAPRVCRTSRVGRPMRRCADAPTQFRRLAADLPSRPRSGANLGRSGNRTTGLNQRRPSLAPTPMPCLLGSTLSLPSLRRGRDSCRKDRARYSSALAIGQYDGRCGTAARPNLPPARERPGSVATHFWFEQICGESSTGEHAEHAG